MGDFDDALKSSTELDDQIINDAMKISPNYPDLLSLGARQAMSALEITLSKNPDGSFNSSDIMAFMKDMGSVGAGYTCFSRGNSISDSLPSAEALLT